MSEFRSVDPSSGTLVEEFPEATVAELGRVAGRAADAFQVWSSVTLAERAAAVRRLGVALRAARERSALVMAEEIGKPLSQGLAEVDKCAHACDYAADHAEAWLGPEAVPTEARSTYITRDPLGPILAIMPWNFPFWQLVRFGASALVVGNTLVLKHAPNAPRCALALQDVFAAAGFPAEVLVNVFAPVASIEALIADDRVAGVTLTGSTRAGRAVAEICGRHLVPSVLELGGSDPFVVLADADVEQAAKVGATARLQNNGQSCIAAKRFIVHQDVAGAFVERFRAELAAARVGDPRDLATTVGPLARRDLRDALAGQVRASVAAGARVVLGGEAPEQPGFWYPPTLLLEPTDAMPAWNEETFGPVAPVRVVRDDEEALALANRSRYALGGAVFTSDPARGEAFARRLRGNGLFVNAMVRSDPRIPFGGTGESGWGRELGRDGMLSFTRTRTVWVS